MGWASVRGIGVRIVLVTRNDVPMRVPAGLWDLFGSEITPVSESGEAYRTSSFAVLWAASRFT